MPFGDVALTEDNVVGFMPADRDPLSVEAERVLMPVLFRYCQRYHGGGVLIRDTEAVVENVLAEVKVTEEVSDLQEVEVEESV